MCQRFLSKYSISNTSHILQLKNTNFSFKQFVKCSLNVTSTQISPRTVVET